MEAIFNRPPVSWLRERDIDLLMCSELHSSGELQAAFGQICAPTGALFQGAWVSYSDIDGETDLIAIYKVGNQRNVLLIENKIAASFQPDQAARYAARAARWRRRWDVVVKTVLICPEAYLSRETSDLFQLSYSYEKIIEALSETADPRSNFFSHCLRDGISAYRQGYQMIPDAEVTSVWSAIWSLAQRETPDLRMKRPAEKPGRSTWIYFHDSLGFDASIKKKCVIAYKADRGQVDLQFSNMRPQDLSLLLQDSSLPVDAEIVQAGKSASLRSVVPKIDFTKPADSQENEIIFGLRRAETIRQFFLDSGLRERLR